MMSSRYLKLSHASQYCLCAIRYIFASIILSHLMYYLKNCLPRVKQTSQCQSLIYSHSLLVLKQHRLHPKECKVHQYNLRLHLKHDCHSILFGQHTKHDQCQINISLGTSLHRYFFKQKVQWFNSYDTFCQSIKFHWRLNLPYIKYNYVMVS